MAYVSFIPRRQSPGATLATLRGVEGLTVARVADFSHINTADVDQAVAGVANEAGEHIEAVGLVESPKGDAEVWFEERAAVLEYDEGLPRAEAEALAAVQAERHVPIAASPLYLVND